MTNTRNYIKLWNRRKKNRIRYIFRQKIYKKRDISEKDFEILKDTFNLRPIFLHEDNRIETSVNKTLNKFDTVIYYTFIDSSVAKIIGDFNEKQSEILGKLKLGDLTQYVKLNP